VRSKQSISLSAVLIFASSSLAIANISGTVFKDFNNDGVFNNKDSVASAVPIVATCDDGNTYTQNTGTDGKYNLNIPGSVKKCRVEAKAEAIGMGDGMNASGGAPLVDFVNNGATSHDISLGSAASYCQANPDVVMAAMPGYFTRGTYWAGGGETPLGHNFGSVFKVPAPQNGTFNNDSTINNTIRKVLAKIDDTGAIWGAAYQKGTKKLFVSAALKRYVPLKDESSAAKVKDSAGTIYSIDTVSGSVSSYVVVPNVLSDTAANELSNRDYGLNKDLDTVKYAGRMGLGDLEISEDDTTLYTVNMNTHQLVKIDIATKAQTTIDIPNPYANGECDNDKVRPWALKVRGKDVFIGSVCENKIDTGDYSTDVGAAIQKYDGTNFTTIAVTNSLRYLRPRGYGPKNGGQGDGYRYENWSSNDNDAPMLTDIEFTNKGDLVLGYNSRQTYNRYGSLKGDIRKMCLNPNGTYTDESSDVAPTNCATHELTYPDNPTKYYEFYTGDFFGGDHGSNGHPETASGALAQAPGAPNIIVGMIDATDWYQPGAIGNYDNTSGDKIGAQAVIDHDTVDNGGEREPYGSKAGGMGDVELLCDPAPIEIGNLVWVDINQDGIQDAAEPAYPNVPVKLQCKENGAYVDYGTATTDSKGHYYFGGLNNVNLANGKTLTAGLDCKLSVAKSDVNNKPATTPNPNNDANDTIDNDAAYDGNNDNVIEFKLSNANNHNLDFGIQPTIGCLVGVLYEDVNNNGTQDGTDVTAPAGITVKATDMFGNTYTAETNAQGQYEFNSIPAGDVTVEVDTTDTDVPEGATWANKTLTGTVAEGTPPSCLEKKFPYTKPSPVDQDPKDNAICANPTSITWAGANVGTATVWQDMLNNSSDATAKTMTTASGQTVDVKMWVENPDGKFYDTDNANSSGSGTSAAFGEPYLTLYLGNQAAPGDGDYLNSDGAGCAAHGYELEAGQRVSLHVEFNESVVLDNWRIRDVDSGDMRNGNHNWEWQDGIKVEAYDKDGNPVEVEAKLGNSAVGLIKDSNGIIHTDKNGGYTATNGNGWDDGDGVTANSAQGQIVLTSNFKPIKRLVITHLAGPDMPCQTRSALAMAGFAVCKPLHISGTVYEDKDGVSNKTTCAEEANSELINNNSPISTPDGVQLNACLVDASNGKVLDTQALNNGHYDFYSGIEPNKDYKVIITTNSCSVGSPAPEVKLPDNWVFEGEKGPGYENPGAVCESNPDGIVKFNVGNSSKEVIDFAINKIPTAKDYNRPSQLNEDQNFTFVQNCTALGDFIEDKATNPDHIQSARDNLKVKVLSVSNGKLYAGGNEITAGAEVTNPDFCALEIDPNPGDTTVTVRYVTIDEAGRESEPAVFKAPFTTIKLTGNVYKDLNRDNTVSGTPAPKACDGNTQLYATLLDSNGNKLSSTEIADDGTYSFYYGDGVRADTNYTIVLTDVSGGTTPHLPTACMNLDGENVNSVNPTGTDGNADGKIDVQTAKVDLEQVDFAITPMVKIGDKVWIEDDNDGDATTGNITPVANTTVTAKCGNLTFTGTTDNSGIYHIYVPYNIGDCNVTVPTPAQTAPAKGSDDSSVPNDNSENDKTHNNAGTIVNVTTTDNLTVDFGFATVGDWSGNVSEDLDNNDTGDKPIANVTIKLYSDPNCDGDKSDGVKVAETQTDNSGNYKFENEVAGCYVAVEEQPNGYFDVTQKIGGDDGDSQGNTPVNEISGKIDPGEEDSGNNFVEEKPGNWCGYVKLDNNADNVADEPIKDVEIKLYPDANADGKVDDVEVSLTTTTDVNGKYCFNNIRPGHYVAVETQPDKLRDVNETEGGGDSDMPDNGVKNAIAGMVYADETDDHNDFLEGLYRIGTLFWIDDNKNSKYDAGEPRIADALIELFDANGTKVAETRTDDNGTYHFDVPAGDYYVKFHLTEELKKKGYIFSDSKNNDDNTIDVNTAGSNGISQKITVGGANNAPALVLTLDAGVNCGCSNVSNDSAPALNVVSMLLMVLFSTWLGFVANRREK